MGAVSISKEPNLRPAQSSHSTQPDCDVLIAGAGIIGLSLALELHRRGARVLVLEATHPLRQASSAAAGMLAVHDPHNPPPLLPLAQLSASLYPEFLRRIESLSGLPVPIQTETTIQHLAGGRTARLAERSLDPRQLAAALLAAVGETTIALRENSPLHHTEEHPRGVAAVTAAGQRFNATTLVYAMGAWALPSHLRIPIAPRKGQMLRVQLPPHTPLHEVHRSEHIYIVPRTHGPQAGTALIGATVEDAGFDTAIHAHDLARLRALAAELLPELAAEGDAPLVEAWAGLRPCTPDGLPLLGRLGDTAESHTAEFVATGHFRNGILLAPATAVAVADLLEAKPAELDLSAFAPERFS